MRKPQIIVVAFFSAIILAFTGYCISLGMSLDIGTLLTKEMLIFLLFLLGVFLAALGIRWLSNLLDAHNLLIAGMYAGMTLLHSMVEKLPRLLAGMEKKIAYLETRSARDITDEEDGEVIP